MTTSKRVAPKQQKSPKQQRSVETVEAILQATIQVLRKQGKARLTTTRIAERAGVSVGTLYQYFPHKTALLQEALRRHLDLIATAMEAACLAAQGKPLSVIADAIAQTWIETKLGAADASIALYSVVEDIEGRAIAADLRHRFTAVLIEVFRSASDADMPNPEDVAATLLGALSGASREMLDPAATPEIRARIGRQICTFVRAYVIAASTGRDIPPVYRETPSSGELAVA